MREYHFYPKEVRPRDRIRSIIDLRAGLFRCPRRLDAVQLRQERAERMRAVMRAHQVPALLLDSGAAAGRYLTELTGADFASQLWYVLFFSESDPVVFAHASYITRGAQEAPWVKEWPLARAWLGGIAGPDATRAETRLFARRRARRIGPTRIGPGTAGGQLV